MDQGKSGLHVGVRQVGEELSQLVGGEHALVDEGAARQGREVGVGLVLRALAQAEGATFEVHARQPLPRRPHDELSEARHDTARGLPQAGRIGGNVAPRDDVEAFFPRDLLDARLSRSGDIVIVREEGHADGVLPCRRQLCVDDATQESIGDLEQDARAVTGIGLSAGRAPVIEVEQCGQAHGDDLVGRLARQRRDEGDAAGIMLGRGIVEPLRGRLRRERKPGNRQRTTPPRRSPRRCGVLTGRHWPVSGTLAGSVPGWCPGQGTLGGDAGGSGCSGATSVTLAASLGAAFCSRTSSKRSRSRYFWGGVTSSRPGRIRAEMIR